MNTIYIDTITTANVAKGLDNEVGHEITELSIHLKKYNKLITYTTNPTLKQLPRGSHYNWGYNADHTVILFEHEAKLLLSFINYINLNDDVIFVTYSPWDIQNLKNRFEYYKYNPNNDFNELILLNTTQKLIQSDSYIFTYILDKVFNTNHLSVFNKYNNNMPTAEFVIYLRMLHEKLDQLATPIIEAAKLVGYHKREIPKGVLGEFSKIEEEFTELKDAVEQNNPILIQCELSDLIGAIEEYGKKYSLSLQDIIEFSNLTKNAFKTGKRS